MSEIMAMGSRLFTAPTHVPNSESSGPEYLLPNPHFVFPARPSESMASSILMSTPSTTSSAPPFRGQNRFRHSASALPTFNFNPSALASVPISPTTPPTYSPLDGTQSPSRGHRRQESELIGSAQNNVATNSSPSKPNSTQSFKPPVSLGLPSGRRHAHRRSGAISCHELLTVMKTKDDPNPPSKCESAPTSPLDSLNSHMLSLPSGDVEPLKLDSESQGRPSIDLSPQKRPPSRARVGFSERIEYIRPLSVISSETESSISTIRGHSGQGSFSSMMGPELSSPRATRPSISTLDPVEDEGILEPQVQISENGCKPKRRAFPWWESNVKTETPFSSSPPTSPIDGRHSLEGEQEFASSHRKPRKVRSWAHSLITRKGKAKKSSRSPSPPPTRDDESETDDSIATAVPSDAEFEINFEHDDASAPANESVDRQQQLHSQPLRQPPMLLTDSLGQSTSEITSPVIDLDAALGPFNTPPMVSNARDNIGRQLPRPRRSMHSLNSIGQVHRRTESAPELDAIEHRSAFPRSIMPDVFEEEDEEDGYQTTPTKTVQLPSTPGFGPSRRKKSEGLVISTNSPLMHVQYGLSSAELLPQTHEQLEEIVVSSEKKPELLHPLATASQSAVVMTPDTMSDVLDSPFFSPSQSSLAMPRLGTSSSSPEDHSHTVFHFGEAGPEVRLSVEDVPSLTSSTSTMASPLSTNVNFPPPAVPPPLAGRSSSIVSLQSMTSAELCAKRHSYLGRFVAGGRSKLNMEQRPMSQHVTLDDAKKAKQRNHRLSKLMKFWKNKETKPTS